MMFLPVYSELKENRELWDIFTRSHELNARALAIMVQEI